MQNKYTMAMIPETLAGYNVYEGDTGDKFLAQTGNMTLATLTAMTNEVTGAGIAGSYNAPAAGSYQSISQEIPLTAPTPQSFRFMNPMKRSTLNIRGMVQVVDRSTGTRDRVPLRITLSGYGTAISPGTLQTGNPLGSTLTMEVTHIKIVLGNETVFEVDKLNQVCIIDGVDIFEEIRRYC